MKFEDIEGKRIEIICRISEKTDYGKYSDSLYYSLDKWAALSWEDFANDIQKRMDNWITAITTPAVPYTPTKDDLEQNERIILDQLTNVRAQKDELYPPKPLAELSKAELDTLKAKYEEEKAAIETKISNVTAAAVSK